jgi:hypothetical protein
MRAVSRAIGLGCRCRRHVTGTRENDHRPRPSGVDPVVHETLNRGASNEAAPTYPDARTGGSSGCPEYAADLTSSFPSVLWPVTTGYGRVVRARRR